MNDDCVPGQLNLWNELEAKSIIQVCTTGNEISMLIVLIICAVFFFFFTSMNNSGFKKINDLHTLARYLTVRYGDII